MWNPTNGEIWVLSKTPSNGRYRLSGRWDVENECFLPIRFGPTQRQAPYPHMMEVSGGGGKPRGFVLPEDPTSLLQSRLRVPVPGGRDSDDLFLESDSDGNGLSSRGKRGGTGGSGTATTPPSQTSSTRPPRGH